MRSTWNVQHMQRVLSTDPIAYWMHDEKQGAVSYDMVTARSDGARNGAYTGVTLGQPGIGDGRTSPFFDGVNDFNNVLTASFNAAFNGATGSLVAWFLPDPTSHADGTNRYLCRIEVNVSHFIRIQKLAGGSTIQIDYRAGAAAIRTHQIVLAAAPTTYGSLGFSWSTTATDSYYNGAPNNSLGPSGGWVGALGIALVGAGSVVPANVYHGRLAHITVWDRVLTPAEFLFTGVL